jgi:hypothetical protein
MKKQQKIDAELFRTAKIAGQQGQNVTAQVAVCFAEFHRNLGGLPQTILEYWKKTYANAPSQGGYLADEAIIWLAAASDLLSLEEYADTKDIWDGFSPDDWTAISEAVNSESGTLPIETLTALLSVIVERGFLN